MVRLDRVGRDLPCPLVAKLEILNPGGASRPARHDDGRGGRAGGAAQAGSTIVEALGQYRRRACDRRRPASLSLRVRHARQDGPEKVALLRAYGAEVVLCPTAVAPDHPDSYYSVPSRSPRRSPAHFTRPVPQPREPGAHERTPDRRSGGRQPGASATSSPASAPAGPSAASARYLKSQKPDVQIVVPTRGLGLLRGSGRPYSSRASERTSAVDLRPGVVDRVVMVSDTDSFLTARTSPSTRDPRRGSSARPSGGAAARARVAPRRRRRRPHPRFGPGYLSSCNDSGCRSRFPEDEGRTVADLLERKGAAFPGLIHVHRARPPAGSRRHGRVRRSRNSLSSRPSPRSRRPKSSAPSMSAISCNERCATRRSSTGR